jgi:hypothetical protein
VALADVVEGAVEAPEPLDGGGDEPLDGVWICHVRGSAVASPPACPISAVAAASACSSRATTTTVAPRRAKSLAAATPIPRLAMNVSAPHAWRRTR